MTSTARPILLAVETSGHTCGVAVYGKEIRYVAQFDGRYLHDQFLAEITYRALRDLQLSPADLDAVAISAGPGSFTGLRIGAAFVKGLCFTQPPSLIAVPTAEAIAFAARDLLQFAPATPIVVLIPSQREKAYVQEFFTPAAASSDIQLLEIPRIQQQYNSPEWIVTGPGAYLCPAAKSVHCFNTLDVRFIAQRAMVYWQQAQFVDPAAFVPFYGQDFVPGKSKKNKAE